MLRSNNMARANGRAFDRTYDRLEQAAISAARRNNAMLLYLPEAPGTVHQNSSTGFTPAVTGSPIGLFLDMQYGAPKFGPELLVNPRFNSGITGWSPFGSTILSSVDGRLRMMTTGPSLPMLAISAIATTPGKTYQVFASSAYKSSQVGVFQLQATNNSNGTAAYASASFGSFGAQSISDIALVFVASAATTYVILRADGGAAATTSDYSEWDNVSARQVIDAPGSRGPELIVNGDFSSWTSDNPNGWTLSMTETATEFVTQASPGARIVATTGNFNEIAQNGLTPAGKTYEIIISVSACSGSGCVSNGSQTPLTFSAPGVYRAIFTSALSTLGLKRAIGGQASDFTVTSISCREVLGYHCTQPTAASKPTRVKVPRRVGPELIVNGGFDSSDNWLTQPGSLISGGSLTLEAQYRSGEQTVPLLMNGASYLLSYDVVSASGTVPLALSSTGFVGVTTNIPAVVGRNSVVVVCADATKNLRFIAPNTGTSVVLDNVSLRVVLDWTSAFQFDGVDDWMDVTFRDYFGATGGYTLVGSWYGPVGGSSATVLAQSSATNINPLVSPLFVASGSNHATLFERGDSGTFGLAGPAYAANAFLQSDCVELQQTASSGVGNYKGWRKGAPNYDTNYASITESLTTNKVTLGAAQRTTIANFARGTFALLCWAPRVMPVADRKAIARFASYLIGANYNG